LSLDAEIRLYGHLFTVENPGDDTWEKELNPSSMQVKAMARGKWLAL
jgi:hypothetical protein